jgi:hypothetical protein
MTGKILLIEGDIDRRWRLSQAIGRLDLGVSGCLKITDLCRDCQG